MFLKQVFIEIDERSKNMATMRAGFPLVHRRHLRPIRVSSRRFLNNRDGMLWGWLSPLRNEMFNSLVPYFQHQHGGEVDSNLKEEVELNLMEVLLSCSFSFLGGKYEI